MRPINDWRIVETLHEFQSITPGYGKSSSLKYQTYYDLSAMPVSDLTEQRMQTLPRGVTFTKHPSHPTMMVLMMIYCLRLQIGIHIWVLINQEMNSIKSIQINLVHLCLLGINSSPDCLGPIQIQIHFLRNKPDRNGLVLSTCQDIFINFESRGQRCST